MDFKVEDCCLARWKPREWYLAHITGVQDGHYDVYWPGDGKSRKGVPAKHVRPCDNHLSVPAVRRGDLIGKDWFFEGDEEVSKGFFRIRLIVDNTYRCTRLTGTGINTDDFDIGYVMRQIREEGERLREL